MSQACKVWQLLADDSHGISSLIWSNKIERVVCCTFYVALLADFARCLCQRWVIANFTISPEFVKWAYTHLSIHLQNYLYTQSTQDCFCNEMHARIQRGDWGPGPPPPHTHTHTRTHTHPGKITPSSVNDANGGPLCLLRKSFLWNIGTNLSVN